MIKYLLPFLLFFTFSICKAETIKAMVIDTGVYPHMDFRHHIKEDINGFHYKDNNGHGTHVTGLILKDTCSQIELISCKYTEGNSKGSFLAAIQCFHRAIKENIKVINFASYGKTFEPIEFYILKQIEKKGIILVTAAGNDNKYLGSPCYYSFPACYMLQKMIIVGALNNRHKRSSISNYGLPGMYWELGEYIYSTLPYNRFGYMSGTSQATALATNKILKNICKRLNQ